jgi:protein-L-isoaspartate(D-aspartate) O-methyltransferase
LKPNDRIFEAARSEMVRSQLSDRGIHDQRVLEAMSRVPRHEFIAAEFHSHAYDDCALPIPAGQTISQPFIVALMLEALELQPQQIALEVGTGSGYQTALLAELVDHVYTIERHPALAALAQERLARLGYNVTVVSGDGSAGLPQHAPFDAISVTAAAPHIPRPLFDQLREGGRMVLPVGPQGLQDLELVEKVQGLPIRTTLSGCRFVPLIGEQGYKAE